MERRAQSQDMAGIIAAIDSVSEEIGRLSARLDAHVTESADFREKMTAHAMGEDKLIESFKEAFPGGDPQGHRSYHDLLIKRAERWEKVQQAIIEKSLTALLWGVFVFIGTAVVEAVRQKTGVR